MSRIGKKPIPIPEGVEVKIEGNTVVVKGSKGELSREIPSEIKVETKEGQVLLSPTKEDRKTRAFWGMARALIYNMVKGVTEGFQKTLELQGVGFRAEMQEDKLVLNVGYSHSVTINIPSSVDVSVEKNIITISGIDKELVGQTAATIRRVKPPEPYKGKGIRYQGEQVRMKEGKKAATK